MTTFNRVITGIQHRNGKFFLTLRYENTSTGEHMDQLASKWFTTQFAAEVAAEQLARQVTARLAAEE